MAQIHWFPGHMNKALKEVEERIKLVDVIIELLDARIPLSSMNEQLDEISKNKKKIIVLTKIDLADPSITQEWKKYYEDRYAKVLTLNINSQGSQKIIAQAVKQVGKEKQDRDVARGMKPQPIKAMILGIPNVGKSSLINRLAGRHASGVQNKPGYTRGEQFVKVDKDFILLDTPGILPMNYENKKKALNLALIGSIREEILPNSDLVMSLLDFLKEHYPHSLQERFNIDEITDFEDVLTKIAQARQLVNSKGEKDLTRAEYLLLKEFKDGKLGTISLESPSWN